MQRNHVDQRRFECLLEFLDRHSDVFDPTTFARSGAAWFKAGGQRGEP